MGVAGAATGAGLRFRSFVESLNGSHRVMLRCLDCWDCVVLVVVLNGTRAVDGAEALLG